MIKIRCRDKKCIIRSGEFLIMGILNITPDSFFDGGKFYKEKNAIKKVENLLQEGTDIIDIGAESSRPHSKPISDKEELKRILPVLKFINTLNIKNTLISIDTYKTNVLKEAAQYKIHIANNIFALRCPYEDNEKYAQLVRDLNLGLVLMHMQGTPQTMQNNPSYKNIVKELLYFFRERIQYAKNMGIKTQNIIIDPGIGFGKLYQHNLSIIKNLKRFGIFKRPILVGISRKSFIGQLLNIDNPQERLYGSLAANLVCILNGANIIRVHDVKETKQMLMAYKILTK